MTPLVLHARVLLKLKSTLLGIIPFALNGRVHHCVLYTYVKYNSVLHVRVTLICSAPSCITLT